jgi:hypothetical protein
MKGERVGEGRKGSIKIFYSIIYREGQFVSIFQKKKVKSKIARLFLHRI